MRTQLLEKNPKARLAVYTIWLPMLAGDARSTWDRGLLDDPRVRHFWDDDLVVGRWFARHDPELGFAGIVWDTYYLYGPESSWDESPTDLVGRGRTVIDSGEQLATELVPLLAPT